MPTRHFHSRFRGLLAVPAALLIAAPLTPVAGAQIPDGMSPEQIQSMVPSEISVPAGETTTVDVGVPVNVNYSAGGWTVTSSGTSVTVTAPDQPGATTSVSGSASGYSATVTLIAVGDGSADVGGESGGSGASGGTGGDSDTGGSGNGGQSGARDRSGGDAPAGGEAAETDDGENGSGGGAGAPAAPAAPAVSHPERSKAEPADSSAAKKLSFDGEIQGNQLVVKVPLNRVKDLMKYVNYDMEGATLRYVDVNGQIIEGVDRQIDKAARTMTLTYPEGETPDNPFIMEIVRDGKADFVAVITATNADVERATGDDSENQYGSYSEPQDQGRGVDQGTSISDIVPLAIASVALLAALALLIVFLRRRRARA